MTAYTRRALLIALVVKSLGYLKSSLARSEEHTSELQSPDHLVCRLLLEKKKQNHMVQSILYCESQPRRKHVYRRADPISHHERLERVDSRLPYTDQRSCTSFKRSDRCDV